MPNILDEIVAAKRGELARQMESAPLAALKKQITARRRRSVWRMPCGAGRCG